MKGYIFVVIAILFEVIGSAMLKLSEGFTVLLPSIGLVVSYFISFAFLILALKHVALSVGYSIWAGLGTAGTALVGYFIFKESLSTLNFFGLCIIIVGVVLLNVSLNENKSPS